MFSWQSLFLKAEGGRKNRNSRSSRNKERYRTQNLASYVESKTEKERIEPVEIWGNREKKGLRGQCKRKEHEEEKTYNRKCII